MQSKAGGGLSGDAVELPKAPRVYKGCTRDTQGIPKGYLRALLRHNTLATGSQRRSFAQCRRGTPQVSVHGLRRPLAVSHSEDHGCGAAHDVAAGEHARDTGHARVVHDDVAPLVQLEIRADRKSTRLNSSH